MSLSRRRFIVWSITTGLISQSRRLLAALVQSGEAPTNAEYLQCLKAWVDTLLPADAHSPGAGDLGVHTDMMDRVADDPVTLKFIKAGCRWLEQEAQKRSQQAFAELDEPDRIAVVKQAETSAPGSLPRVFFEYTREDVYLLYYAHPESWAMLNYPGPPQPLGFLDYTQPPKGTTW